MCNAYVICGLTNDICVRALSYWPNGVLKFELSNCWICINSSMCPVCVVQIIRISMISIIIIMEWIGATLFMHTHFNYHRNWVGFSYRTTAYYVLLVPVYSLSFIVWSCFHQFSITVETTICKWSVIASIRFFLFFCVVINWLFIIYQIKLGD